MLRERFGISLDRVFTIQELLTRKKELGA